MSARLRTMDWTKTSLGPIERWPFSLISYTRMILELPSPAIIFWGPELSQIYNEGYAVIMGPRHPRYLGAPYRESWPDTYPVIFPWMQKVLQNGEVIRVDRTHITVARHGYPEEAYFTFTFSPLRDDDGAIVGIFQPVAEVTGAVLSERRAETLRALEPRADSVDALADAVAALSASEKDIPFAVIYLWDDSWKRLQPVVRTRNVAAVSLQPIEDLARRAFQSGAAIETDRMGDLLAGHHIGPWPEPTRGAFVLPIRSPNDEGPRGVALFGLSARLPFDERYRAFLEVAAGQVLRAVSARRVLLETQWQREQLYEVLMQAPVPICVLRSDELLVEMANPLYHQLVGHTELVGRPLLDGIPEARGQGFDVALRRVMESGQPLIGREILIRLDRDGDGALEETYFTFIYAPMRDRTGVANRVMIIAHDVTDQVLARRRIEESEEKIRRILAQVDAGISQVDMNGRFALMNDRYCEITGRTRDELRQLRMDAILHPDDRARHIEQLGRVLQEKTTFSVEERYVRPDGSLVWVQNSVSRVDDPRGHPQGVALVTVDITERKSAEDERDRLLEELSRTVRFSEMFVGILGHDLRNPLSAISTSATLLGRRAADDERFTKLVGRILGSVERMDRMISQLLDFTRIRIGNGIPLQCASVDLADVARAAVEEIESSCVRPIDVLTTGDTAGTWDRDRLTQLVSNLAANACQHGGDAPISIAVDGSEPDTVRLEVRNGGVIPADVMPSIFDPFRRATDRARGGSGLGLGLYITQQIALAHGGTIAAESRDERTRFVVELPRHAAQGDDRVFVTTASSPPPPNVGRT